MRRQRGQGGADEGGGRGMRGGPIRSGQPDFLHLSTHGVNGQVLPKDFLCQCVDFETVWMQGCGSTGWDISLFI